MEDDSQGRYFCAKCDRTIEPEQQIVTISVKMRKAGAKDDSDNGLIYSWLCLSCAAYLLTESVLQNKCYLAIDIENYRRDN
jgi:hypothetical protein